MRELVPASMAAVLLLGHGGPEQLEYRTDVAVPRPGPGELLVQVAAAALNNTDVNTRLGWYSKSVTSGTADSVGGATSVDDAAWSGSALEFPRIQGADVCGRVVDVGSGVPPERVGERVLVRTMLRSGVEYRPYECWTLGSECDGGFAQFVVAPAQEVYSVRTDWSDVELAAVPCAYSTAENMLHRASVGAERVLVTGASGGVGLAAVQLARRRGAHVVAVAAQAKAAVLLEQGAYRVLDRGDDPVEQLGAGSFDVVLDLVGGSGTSRLLDLLRPGGRYAIAGAIAGPIAEIDLRTVYLKDLALIGCTFQEDEVFENLVGYVERDEFRPVVADTYPLSELAEAQEAFMSKRHVGKIVVLPPSLGEQS